MKKYLIIILFFTPFFNLSLEAFTANLEVISYDTLDPEVYKIVEYMPHFPGCEHIEDKIERKQCSDNGIINFINENITYPERARRNNIEGVAVIRFVVEKDGTLGFDEDIRKVILRDPGGGCGKESLKVVKAMPDWIPGRHQGLPVRVQFTLPIKFQLADDDMESGMGEVDVNWNGLTIAGKYKVVGDFKLSRGDVRLISVTKLLKGKSKNLPIVMKYESDPYLLGDYYISVGLDTEKYEIKSGDKNKKTKKALLSKIMKGKKLYFYKEQDGMPFLELNIK